MHVWSFVLQVKVKVQEVKDMRERLQKTWDDRKNYYDQMFDLQIFMRDAEQLNSISTSQEVGGQQTVHLFHHQSLTALGYRRCRKLRTILFRVWNYEKSLSLSFSLSLSLSLKPGVCQNIAFHV